MEFKKECKNPKKILGRKFLLDARDHNMQQRYAIKETMNKNNVGNFDFRRWRK